MRRRPIAVLVPLAAAFLFACSDGDDPAGPGGAGGDYTATIDGVPWQTEELYFTVTPGGASTPGALIISGQSGTSGDTRVVLLILGFVEGPGTYPLGVNNGTTGGGTGGLLFGAGTSVTQYLTPFSGSAGSVNLTAVSGGRLAGTFTFTAAPIVGSGASVSVTNGSFDTELPSNFVPVAGDGRGSSMSATLNGTAWVGATNLSVGTPGAYVVTGSTTAYSITIAAVGTTPGSYPLGTGLNITVSEIGTSNAWGSSGSTGTVTITGGGTTRSIGTFSASLPLLSGSGGALVITNGTFDIVLP